MFTDDLDGSEAAGTVLFGLDGTHYEIDLSTEHARELRTALARYAEAGRKVTATARRARQNGRTTPADGSGNAQARSWAKAHGLDVKDRSRVPAGILALYRPPRAASTSARRDQARRVHGNPAGLRLRRHERAEP